MIRLGVIGMSAGNGHPYSWSAIINGYDRDVMASCPFPVIPDYLGKQVYPDDFIKGAKVTHIWTQERVTSEHIAKASYIDNVAGSPEDMIGNIDALLLARDDHENHHKFAQPFLAAGLPVYIDKPLANELVVAESLYALEQREAQIYTCSALRYARELDNVKKRAKDIIKIKAFTPKSWTLYAIHIVEPIVAVLGAGEVQLISVTSNSNGAKVNAVIHDCDIHVEATGLNTGKIEFTFEYKDGSREHVVIGDMFYAFRGALAAFLESIKTGKRTIPKDETLTCMRLLEMGAV